MKLVVIQCLYYEITTYQKIKGTLVRYVTKSGMTIQRSIFDYCLKILISIRPNVYMVYVQKKAQKTQ